MTSAEMDRRRLAESRAAKGRSGANTGINLRPFSGANRAARRARKGA